MKKLMFAGGLVTLLAACASGPQFTTDQIVRPADMTPVLTDRSALVTKGEALWNDKSLSSNGLACSSCHVGNVAAFKTTFKEPYPHQVEMASDMGGLETIDADGMVQLCMLVPMKADILPWDSEELAALTAYVVDVVQPDYQQKAP
ncbi:MAG: hypothetical protein V3U76_17990 [Granulosicoccus sp.]